MKFGFRTPSLSKSFKARTTGRMKRAIKRSSNPFYGKRGMGYLTNPKKALYNKAYSNTTYGVNDIVKIATSGTGKQKHRTCHKNSGRYTWWQISLLVLFWPVGLCFVAYWAIKNFSADSAEDVDKRKKLQQIVCNLPENSLLLSKQQVNAAASQYSQQKMRIAQECVSILETSKIPETFFSRLCLLKEVVHDLAEIEPYYDGIQDAISQEQHILSQIEPSINAFIDRYVESAKADAQSLKTERGRISRYKSQISVLEQYTQYMSSENLLHLSQCEQSLISSESDFAAAPASKME